MRIFPRMRFRPFLLSLGLLFAHAPAAQADFRAASLYADSTAETEADDFDSYAEAAARLVDEAMGYLGIRYRFGGTSPETGLDCSGLVLNVFRNALGLDLPRTARAMAGLGDRIGRQELQPGDLVFFNTMRRTFSHVGIYLGEDKFVHAPSSGGRVRIESIRTRYWAERFTGARRLLDEVGSPILLSAR